MSIDPYAPPLADVNRLVAVPTAITFASRGSRLLAAMIDMVSFMAPLVPAALVPVDAIPPWAPLVAGVALLGIATVQFRGFLERGQSIGKRVVGIKVVQEDGSLPNFRTFARRSMIFWVVGVIPYLGGIVSLMDVMSIFGSERRCLHDFTAKTHVVRA